MTGEIVWLIDDPTPFSPRAEWVKHLKGLRELAAREPHPQLDEAIAKAQAMVDGALILPALGLSKETSDNAWLINEPPSIAPKKIWREHLEYLRQLEELLSHPDIDAAIARAEATLQKPADMFFEEGRLKPDTLGEEAE